MTADRWVQHLKSITYTCIQVNCSLNSWPLVLWSFWIRMIKGVIGMLISLNLIDWLVQPLKCITYTCIQVNCGQNSWLLHDASLDINVSLVLLNQHDQRSNWYGHIINRPIMMGTTFQRYHLHLHPSKLWPEFLASWWCNLAYQHFFGDSESEWPKKELICSCHWSQKCSIPEQHECWLPPIAE